MKKLFFRFTIIVSILLSSANLFASHIAGGEITYNCLGGNQYEVNLNLFVDCLGFDPGSSQVINITSSCGGTASLTVNCTNVGGTEISQLCPSQLANSTCNGGTLPGMWLFSYTGIVTLAPPCDTWTMSWSTCCRNLAITNLSSASSNYYIEATLNSATAPCNSSPSFTAQPIPYVCNGQSVSYSYGVVEPDGDSLYYSLIPAMDAAGVSSTYNPGYSGTSPIPGIVIDPNTGLVTFTPGAIGNYVVVILVQEYDSNGNLVGTVMRDIQFVVQNCTNSVPDPSGGAITSFGGNAVQTGPYSLEMCAGNNFNFNVVFSDSDPGTTLTYTSNISAALPGAVITSSGTDPLTLNVSWTSPAGTSGAGLTFTITVSDGACPIQGQQTYVYSVNILDATTANPDITICGSQTAQLNAYGGSTFNWSVVSGAPMTPANFSCNPCSNPVASPNVTTTYAVISNLSGTCDNVDTVTVFVVPDFTYTVTQSSANSCLQDPVQLDVTGLSPAGPGYTFQWTPAANLSNPTIANPIATFIAPGTYTYTLTVTSPGGCIKTSTVTIYAAPAFAPVITAYGDTSFCAGGTASLGVLFTGGSTPASCGLSATGTCGGTAIIGAVGTSTGSNTSTTWPAPYGNWYTSAKHQFLFTAAELNAAGITGGKIDQLDFNVSAINGITTYHEYTIKMGCTNLTALGPSWVGGLYQVFNPKNVTIALGWNSHIFDNAFEWDGLSNVVVEICFTEGPPYANYSYSSISPWTTTSFVSCLYSYTDSFDMCPDLTNFIQTSNNRPLVQLHWCSLVADPADYTYQWTPASGSIASPTSQFTAANPTAITDYYVTVTDIAGGCQAVDSVHVDVINISTLSITPAGPYCVNANTDTLTTSVPVGTGTWSGPGITNTSLGIFDPATAGVGSHQIIYTISGSCGTGADTTTIVVTPLPDPTITPVGNQCASGASITLSAVTPGGTWSGTGITNPSTGTFDPATAGIGNHLITYSISSPCFAQDTVIITVTSQLNATITDVGPFCTASPAITMNAADPGGVWSGTGITNSSAGTFDPATAGPGTHVITYTISGLCGSADTTSIVVLASPVISIVADTTEGCEPTTVNFTGVTDQPGGSCYWEFGDGNTSTNCNPSEEYLYAGSYSVTFTYANTIGCSSTVMQSNMINIHSQPVAAFTATPQPTTIVNPTVTLTDQSTGIIDTYSWDIGGFVNYSTPNVVYTFADTGAYNVTLIVTNNFGCADTAYSTVLIDQILVFYAPNAFTPNGNGLNDVFNVKGDGIDPDAFQMRIFDRWGDLLFHTTNLYEGWNGAINNTGNIVEQDVYIWKVDCKDFKGNTHSYIGHVTLTK